MYNDSESISYCEYPISNDLIQEKTKIISIIIFPYSKMLDFIDIVSVITNLLECQKLSDQLEIANKNMFEQIQRNMKVRCANSATTKIQCKTPYRIRKL